MNRRQRLALASTVLGRRLRPCLAPECAKRRRREHDGAHRRRAGTEPAGLDGLTIDEVMQRFRVPGVSIAVIKDFASTGRRATASPTSRGAGVERRRCSRRRRSASPCPRWRRCGWRRTPLSLDSDINTILKSWRVPATATREPVTPRSLISHTSGADDGFGFPGYDPDEPRPTPVQILNGEKPSNVGWCGSRGRRTGLQVLGRRRDTHAAGAHRYRGRAVRRLMRATVLGPLR